MENNELLPLSLLSAQHTLSNYYREYELRLWYLSILIENPRWILLHRLATTTATADKVLQHLGKVCPIVDPEIGSDDWRPRRMAQLRDLAKPLEHRMCHVQELIFRGAADEGGAQHQMHLQHRQRKAQRHQLRSHGALFGLELPLKLRQDVALGLANCILHALTIDIEGVLLGVEAALKLLKLRLERHQAVLDARLQLANGIGGALHLLRGLLPGGLDVHAMDSRVGRRVAKARGAQHALDALTVHDVLLAVGRATALRVLGAFAHVHHLVRREHFRAMRVVPAVRAQRLSCSSIVVIIIMLYQQLDSLDAIVYCESYFL